MENHDVLDLDWLPGKLDTIFEDAHADTHGQWETVDAPQQDSKAA